MSDGGEPVEKITLVDHISPVLTAGDYELTATQTLVGVTSKAVESAAESEPLVFESGTGFHVRGSRFALQPDDIYSVYPPDAQEGAYENTIPHVVLTKKTLPWERRLTVHDEPGRKTPWMALIMLSDEEMMGPEPETAHAAAVETFEIAKLFGGKIVDGCRLPYISTEYADRLNATSADTKTPTRCQTLKIKWELLRKVVPRLHELHYLAHARQVAIGHKEDISGIGDGWFSVIIGNRTPALFGKHVDGVQYQVFLVSLEGLEDLITEQAPAMPKEVNHVRLVLMLQWSFRSTNSSLEKLLKGLADKDRDAWLRIVPDEEVENEAVKTALKLGYVPIRHMLRLGEQTVSWYRGPLAPYQTPTVTNPQVYRTADDALRLDPDSGMFDVSYAAAWQLGRLLALQAPEFARTLFHQKASHLADAMIHQAQSGQIEGLEHAEELLQNELMAAVALEWWG